MAYSLQGGTTSFLYPIFVQSPSQNVFKYVYMLIVSFTLLELLL